MKEITLCRIASVQQGYTFKPEYQGQGSGKWMYVKVGDLNSLGNMKYVTRTKNYIGDDILLKMKAKPFPAGSIVFSRVGAALRLNNKRILSKDCVTDDNVLVITVSNKAECYPEFLYYWFESQDLQRFCNDGTVPVISGSNLKKQTVLLPALPEQYTIAGLLSTWDAVIDKTERLVAAKESLLDKLKQDLLTRKKRIYGYKKSWRKYRLSEVLVEHGALSTGQEQVYSVSVHKDLINQIEHLGRSFAAKDRSNYNLVKPGDIVYTKSPTGDFPYGIIKQSRLDFSVIVSPLYGVFTPRTPQLGTLLHYYFESPVNIGNYLRPIIQKGAKNTIGITNSTFLTNSLCLPTCDDEAKAIAVTLNTAAQEIDLLKNQANAYRQQKRGLMQKLLTGQWRVKTLTRTL